MVTVEELADVMGWVGRAEKKVLRDAAPKPWIVDVAQQHRPKRTRGHRRVK